MELIEKSPNDPLVDEPSDIVQQEKYSVEDAIEAIGFGKFQVLLTLCTGFLWTADSMEMVINTILSPVLVCEWDLSSLQEAMISTVAFIGQGIGAMCWGYIGDKYGRKITLCASAATVFLFGVVSSQVPFYWSMLLCRFLIGLGIGGIPLTVAILTEVLPVHRRSKAVLLFQCFWGAGSVFAASLAIGVVNVWGWRYYLLILSSPLIVFLIGSWWIPESPRYLLISGQIEKLNALLKRIANANKKDAPKRVDLEVVVPSRGKVLDLFTERFRLTTVLLFVMWFTTAFCYYGIGLLTTQMFQSGINGCHPHISKNLTATSDGCRRLSNGDYTDLMATSSGEIPFILLVIFVIDKVGRKLCLTFEYGVGFISIMALLFCSSRAVEVAFLFIFRGTLSNSFATIYLYTAEVFPTNIRSVGLGCCSMIGRFGSLTAPFVAQVLIHRSFYLVIAVYAVLLSLSVISSLLLRKETNHLPLEDSSATALNTNTENYQTFE